MGAGLRITTVILLFLILYILYGVVYNFLAGTNLLGEFSVDTGSALLLVVSWPVFIFLLAKGGGDIGAFIASAVILAIIVILFWIAHLIDKILFLRNHKGKKTQEEKFAERELMANKLKQKSEKMNFKPNLQKVIFSLVIAFGITLITMVFILQLSVSEQLEQSEGILRTAMIFLPNPIVLLYLLILLVLYYIAVYIIWSFIEKSKIKSKQNVKIVKKK